MELSDKNPIQSLITHYEGRWSELQKEIKLEPRLSIKKQKLARLDEVVQFVGWLKMMRS